MAGRPATVRWTFRRQVLAALLAVAVAPAVLVGVVTWSIARLGADAGRSTLLVAVVADGLLILATAAFAWRVAGALADPIQRLREGVAILLASETARPLAPPANPDLAAIAHGINALSARAGPSTQHAHHDESEALASSRQALEALAEGGLFAVGHAGTVPAPDARLAALSFVVLDLETTGLDPHGGDRVVSIGAVRVRAGRVERADAFATLVDPERPIPAVSTRIHGIDDVMVRGQPQLADVLPSLGAYVGDSVVVGHAISFDLAFLTPALAALGRPPLHQHGVLDTLLLAHALLPASLGAAARRATSAAPAIAADSTHGPVTLDEIAAVLGVEVVGRHTALGDALTTAEVFVRLLGLMRQRGVQRLGEALALQSPSVLRRVLGSLLAGH